MEDDSESTFWNSITKFFRQRDDESLEALIQEARKEGRILPEDASMLLNVLRLEKKQVADIMIPRPDIICADLTDGFDEVCRLIVTHGHSRIPIYKENRDHMVGVVYAKDLLRALLSPEGSNACPPHPDLSAILRDPLFISETLNLRRMLLEFRGRKKHIAIALDEYGGTSGLLTLEDVLEEIVGEIEDEHEPHKPEELQVIDEHTLLVSGRAPLEDLNERLGVRIESEQVETIGGYLSELAGRVPRKGDAFTLLGRRFTVKESDKRQVRWILVEDMPPQTPDNHDRR
ncbi:MAG: hemolysin family protein [Desulfovibrionaceae bacterium]|nr:hemolysin family protein [Desulfovibrionaceae bacterium]